MRSGCSPITGPTSIFRIGRNYDYRRFTIRFFRIGTCSTFFLVQLFFRVRFRACRRCFLVMIRFMTFFWIRLFWRSSIISVIRIAQSFYFKQILIRNQKTKTKQFLSEKKQLTFETSLHDHCSNTPKLNRDRDRSFSPMICFVYYNYAL